MPTEVYLQGAMETSGKAPVLREERASCEGVSQEQGELFEYCCGAWICLLDTALLPLWL